ncbi:MAG: nucleotidyltransferase domain-containing protein [Candidatus Njordarchaeia archaeon]
MESIIRKREGERLRAIELAKKFLECAKKHFNIKEAYVVGSYARGDFNEWSDIDLVLVAENVPKSPIERLSKIKECLKAFSKIEPIIISPEVLTELRSKRNPIAVEIEKHGIKIF